MPVVRTPMKNFPSKRGSRANRALRQMVWLSFTVVCLDYNRAGGTALAVFGHEWQGGVS